MELPSAANNRAPHLPIAIASTDHWDHRRRPAVRGRDEDDDESGKGISEATYALEYTVRLKWKRQLPKLQLHLHTARCFCHGVRACVNCVWLLPALAVFLVSSPGVQTIRPVPVPVQALGKLQHVDAITSIFPRL